jgi:hypothetical protein
VTMLHLYTGMVSIDLIHPCHLFPGLESKLQSLASLGQTTKDPHASLGLTPKLELYWVDEQDILSIEFVKPKLAWGNHKRPTR